MEQSKLEVKEYTLTKEEREFFGELEVGLAIATEKKQTAVRLLAIQKGISFPVEFNGATGKIVSKVMKAT